MIDAVVSRTAALLNHAYLALVDAALAQDLPVEPGDLRDLVRQAGRELATWVALGDGAFSLTEQVVLDQLLGEPGQAGEGLGPVTTIAKPVGRLDRLCQLLEQLAPEHASTAALLCQAMEEVFHTVIAADGSREAEFRRVAEVVDQLRLAATTPSGKALPAPLELVPAGLFDVSGSPSPLSATAGQVAVAGGPPPTTAAAPVADQAKSDAAVAAILADLDALVGLATVKHEVRTLLNLAKVFAKRRAMGLAVAPMSFHLVFTGNPGTGKTTVARIIARLYGALGLLTKGHLVEVDRSGLVAGFIGQTAIKVDAVIASALGGVLFIDEAYMLDGSSANDFGHEAVAALLKGMEDHRGDLVVIAAGYGGEMHRFLDMNPGLRSRLRRELVFQDYSAPEMVEIFDRMALDAGYRVDPDGLATVAGVAERWCATRDQTFGNAREVRNLFEQVVGAQANRVCDLAAPTPEDMQRITAADIGQAAGTAAAMVA